MVECYRGAGWDFGARGKVQGVLNAAKVDSGVPKPLQHFPATRKPPPSHRLRILVARNSRASCVGLQLPWLAAEWEEQGKVISDANSHQVSCFLRLFPLQGLVTPKNGGVPQQASAEMGFWGIRS